MSQFSGIPLLPGTRQAVESLQDQINSLTSQFPVDMIGIGPRSPLIRDSEASRPFTYGVVIASEPMFNGDPRHARWRYTVATAGFLYDPEDGDEPIKYDSESESAQQISGVLNFKEMGHLRDPEDTGTPWYVWGVDVNGTDYPAGFLPRQIGYDVAAYPVKLYAVPTRFGVLTMIDEFGSHDGTCT